MPFFTFLYLYFSGPRFKHLTPEKRNDIFEMIENAAYIICGDESIDVSLWQVNSRYAIIEPHIGNLLHIRGRVQTTWIIEGGGGLLKCPQYFIAAI